MTPDQITSISWTPDTDPVIVTGSGADFTTGRTSSYQDEDGETITQPQLTQFTASVPQSDMPTDGSDPSAILKQAIVDQNQSA